MKFARLVFLTAFIPAAAFAQAPQQGQPSPNERAMSARILTEISANVQANAEIFQLKDELAKAQARIKELETELAKKGK